MGRQPSMWCVHRATAHRGIPCSCSQHQGWRNMRARRWRGGSAASGLKARDSSAACGSGNAPLAGVQYVVIVLRSLCWTGGGCRIFAQIALNCGALKPQINAETTVELGMVYADVLVLQSSWCSPSPGAGACRSAPAVRLTRPPPRCRPAAGPRHCPCTHQQGWRAVQPPASPAAGAPSACSAARWPCCRTPGFAAAPPACPPAPPAAGGQRQAHTRRDVRQGRGGGGGGGWQVVACRMNTHACKSRARKLVGWPACRLPPPPSWRA